MPSPFPGMDPYLEHPGLWPEVHQYFITFLAMELNRVLPPRYVARMGLRVYVEAHAKQFSPDVWIKQTSRPGKRKNGALTVAACDTPWELAISSDGVEESYIEIRERVGKTRLVVTHIEVLSPGNKMAGTPGRKQYRQKQRQVLKSKTHLLEIDLLRRGRHTVSVLAPLLKELSEWDYLVSLSRARKRKRWQVWPIALKDRLPRILVPLANGDPDVVVDLQSILNRVYEEGVYETEVDYREDPAVPLKPHQTRWAAKLLKAHGLRP
jgi:hypothetical protein